EKLTAGGYNPKGAGPGQWRSRCPGHDGDSPNLSIKEETDGTVLVRCHHADESGHACSAKAIVEGVGLTLADLFPAVNRKTTAKKANAPRAAPANGNGAKPGPGYKTAELAFGNLGKHLGKLVTVWDYLDAEGNIVAKVARFDSLGQVTSSGKPKKEFR